MSLTILALTLFQFYYKFIHGEIDLDFSNHPCRRSCKENVKMNCYYELTIEKYFSMQPECLNCTKGNVENCQNNKCIVADGRSRMVTAFNGMLPGPTIEVCQDDKIIVDIHNNLYLETTTIHWHGIHQRKTQRMDGVPMVTQDPILPGSTFRYEFWASEPGTTFYHSHSFMQRTNGAYGHLIIKQSDIKNYHYNLYDHDLAEHTISLTDWFAEPTETHLLRYLRTKEFYDGAITTILINGHGSINNVPPKIFNLEPSQRYRFRLIHAGAAACPFKIQIKNHKLLFISADGSDIKPIEADSLVFTNGERYDFILESNQSYGVYQILITGFLKCEDVKSSAFVQYGNSSTIYQFEINKEESNSNELVFNCRYGSYPNCINYKEMESIKNINPVLTGKPDFQYFLTLNVFDYALKKYRGVEDSELRAPFINNISSIMPRSTLLKHGVRKEKSCNKDTLPKGDLKECLHLVNIPLNSVVEFIIVDEGDETSHPMHLHGYSFHVVGQGKIGKTGSMDVVKKLDKAHKLTRNLKYPIVKDTVDVPEGGYIILRFLADNPGFWLFHCHVDFHMEEGMHMIFRVLDLKSG